MAINIQNETIMFRKLPAAGHGAFALYVIASLTIGMNCFVVLWVAALLVQAKHLLDLADEANSSNSTYV